MMPQLSPANGLYMFMLLFTSFWMILFLIQLKFPMIHSYKSFLIMNKKNYMFYYN
uniref:ATP synthase F0 subunit 8 n=1 Tax=Partulina redfieldi TaxID=115954 RepID=A0A3Q9U0B3_9EUPU|nr:ATP synthase F0 subunit 8 [Partulina redfieldi]AZZ06746.1 ATP synthase F0 subunit 8 [Partulina redfieldi]